MKTLVCKGCGNTGVNIFTSSGYCVCPHGKALKAKDDLRADEYFDSLHSTKVTKARDLK